MSNAFDARNPPFDRLTSQEVEALRANVDIEYFPPQTLIIKRDDAAQFLYVVLKGAVEERDGDDLQALLGPNDSFDSRAIVQGVSACDYITREETLCYLVPVEQVRGLIQKNPRFGAFFYLDISRKLEAISQDSESGDFSALMRVRVRDLFLHPAHFITPADTLQFAGQKMEEVDSNALFVRGGERIGIVTGMNLAKGVLLRGMTLDDSVGPLAHYDIVSLSADEFVASALILMTKHNKRRIAVRDGDEYIGFLEDIDVLGLLAGNSQLVAGRIDRASSVEELAGAAHAISEQVRMLRRQGVKVEVIGEIISDLNRRMLARLFNLLAPQTLKDKACLIVMGSEGRGEQTMRTDQDNGLILSEPVDEVLLDAFRTAFSGALESFGFPPCPGNVMVINPIWSKTLEAYTDDFRRWVALPDADAHMNVAIFYDGVAVAGQLELLDTAKAALLECVRGETAYLSHFAKAVEMFPTPIGFFNNLIARDGDGHSVDLKKGGIFPIVHGVRSLAIEKGITATRTDERIARLADMGTLKPEFARELTQALHYLMSLRLDSQIEAMVGGGSNLMKPGELSSMERDLLRDALQLVKQFRELLRHHFNLNMF